MTIHRISLRFRWGRVPRSCCRPLVTDRRRQQEESPVDPAAVVAWLLSKLTTRSPSIAIAANRLAGRTTETVPGARAPCERRSRRRDRCRRRRRHRSTQKTGHPPHSRFGLPPVWVLSPVSTSVTPPGLGGFAVDLHPVPGKMEGHVGHAADLDHGLASRRSLRRFGCETSRENDDFH